jgi:orotidine-5'-phosphate decarboxylase
VNSRATLRNSLQDDVRNPMTFQQKLNSLQDRNNSLLCIGLDSDWQKLPDFLKTKKDPIFQFNKAIIDATFDLVCSYKPNTAFYESLGEEGIRQLEMTCDYLSQNYPAVPIIIDAKRADIGNTNQGYVDFVFKYLQADAVTVNPYLGKEALQSFLDQKEKGIIILCKTSNPGSGEFQDLKIAGKPFYQIIARQIVKHWNQNNNCLLVVGATYPRELVQIRKMVGDMTLLIPGIGSQGGDVQATVTAGKNKAGKGMIINSSRGIIFASTGRDFAAQAREQALILKNTINQWR